MASNKKTKLSLEEIHTLLDDFDSDDENDIDNLANDSATEFVDRTATENLEIDISEDIYKKVIAMLAILIQQQNQLKLGTNYKIIF